MEIKIGIAQVTKELSIETSQSQEQVEFAVREALSVPAGLFVLDDGSGRRLMIPAARLGYLELGQEPHRQVGFGVLAP